MGSSAGSIMATIITVHMPVNMPKWPSQLCPGMRIQVMDMAQPPGISMPGMDDMEPHQAMVTATQTMKISVAVARNARSEFQSSAGLSGLGVFIITLPPESLLVAAQRRAV